MARYRLSPEAQADIAAILRRSETLHGREARDRYRGLLTAALRRISRSPHGPATADRGTLLAGLRSLHLKYGRAESREAPVAAPVHVIYYRANAPGPVEIARVLHERMEPDRHFDRENREAF